MAIVLNSARDLGNLSGRLRDWAYNAMDCCITHEVCGKIKEELDPLTDATYTFSRLLVAPVLEMMSRGILVDVERREAMAKQLAIEIEQVKKNLYRILDEGCDVDVSEFNWRSTQQLGWLFYDHFKLPEFTKDKKRTIGRDALERLARYPIARFPVKLLLTIKDKGKMLGVLKGKIDDDKRIRCTSSMCGTETGRFATYASAFGKGQNLQNQDPELRYVFIADPGMKMAYIDLEQAESRAVGAKIFTLFGDPTYLDACENGGDLHTNVAKMVWPDIKTREQADILYQAFGESFRQCAKKLGHATNYLGQPYELQKRLKIPQGVIEDFQRRYFKAFPGMGKWHRWVVQQLNDKGYIVSLTGRKRWFLGRRDEDSTVGEAVAYDPQETVARLLNQGMFNIWWESVNNRLPIQLLLQVHDATLIQYPEETEDITLPSTLDRILIPTVITAPNGQQRKFTIPSEAKVGWNWGERFKTDDRGQQWEFDPNGLSKWKGPGKDLRARHKAVQELDRILS